MFHNNVKRLVVRDVLQFEEEARHVCWALARFVLGLTVAARNPLTLGASRV